MWWSDHSAGGRLARLAALVAACAGGCFQPLYGDQSGRRGPGIARVRCRCQADRGAQGHAEARLAVEVRNALLFDFTGGGAARPTHRLTIKMSSNVSNVIVDSPAAARRRGLRDQRDLRAHRDRTGKAVVTGQTFSRVSYDIPGQQQRFAGDRGCATPRTAPPR